MTAYGWDSEYCKVAYWNEADGIQVRCFDAAGSPVDTRYVVAFTGPLVIGRVDDDGWSPATPGSNACR